MAAALGGVFGNASSTHSTGQAARRQLESSRRSIAGFLNVPASDLVLTSGGTEANNLAIFGLFDEMRPAKAHAVTSAIEHPSVLECFRQLERDGVEVSYVMPGADGIVTADAIAAEIRLNTLLVSLMHANNETGCVQPVALIARTVRERRASGQAIFMHSDGVQALGKIPALAAETDLYSASAHKLYAPKGTGALCVRKGTPLRSVQLGGKHERGRRAGTENVPGAVAFARALDLCRDEEEAALTTLRNRFEREVLSALDDVEINGSRDYRLPNTSNLLFRGVSAEAMLIALDMQGIAVSTGAACSSGSIEPSPVLLAMGRSKDEARSSIRFSFGRYNTPNDVEQLIEAVIGSVRRLRRTSAREVQLVRVTARLPSQCPVASIARWWRLCSTATVMRVVGLDDAALESAALARAHTGGRRSWTLLFAR